MKEETNCVICGTSILRSTADLTAGKCMPCKKDPIRLIREPITETLESHLEKRIDFRTAQKRLKELTGKTLTESELNEWYLNYDPDSYAEELCGISEASQDFIVTPDGVITPNADPQEHRD